MNDMKMRPKKWLVLSGVLVLGTAVFATAKYLRVRADDNMRGEAKAILAAIILAEESYRAEHQEYLDVSAGSTAMHPRDIPTPDAAAWDQQTPISARFAELMLRNPLHRENVRFVYTVFAGRGSVPKDKLPKAVHHWLPFRSDPWYVALAVGDLDGDGVLQYVAAASEYDGVWVLSGD